MDPVAFSAETSREIAALSDAEGCTVEQWLNRYVLDIRRAVHDRGGIEALEAATAAFLASADTAEIAVEEA